MNLLARFLGTVLALYIATEVIPGFFVDTLYAAAIVAVILGIINITLKPLVFIITLPLQILTLGLFTFVVNAGFLLFVASFIEGFSLAGTFVDQFVAAFLGALIITLTLWVVDLFTKKRS